MPKNIDEIYQKKEHRQHIYDLPDTYIGSAEPTLLQDCWVIEDETVTQEDINFVPGLYKIFDEVLTNASDHKVRTTIQSKTDNTIKQVKNIKVHITDNMISVENDGDGIDIIMHSKENVYVPEMIFGQLLTSQITPKKIKRGEAKMDMEPNWQIFFQQSLLLKQLTIHETKFILKHGKTT